MNKTHFSFFLFFLLFVFGEVTVFAKNRRTINVLCQESKNCRQVQKIILDFFAQYEEENALQNKELIFEKIKNQYPEFLNFKVDKKESEIIIESIFSKKFSKISIKSEEEFEGILLRLLPVQVGDFVTEENIKKGIEEIKKFFEKKGANNSVVEVFLNRENDSSYSLTYTVLIKDLKKIEKIFFKNEKHPFFLPIELLQGEVFEERVFEKMMESIKKKFWQEGYFDYQLSYLVEKKGHLVTIFIEFKAGKRFIFSYEGFGQNYRSEFFNFLGQLAKNNFNFFRLDKLKEAIEDFFSQKGLFRTVANVRLQTIKNKENEENYFFIKIQKGEKIPIEKIYFEGDVSYEKELQELFWPSGNDLSQAGFLDKENVEKFVQEIKKFYLARGYLKAIVDDFVFIEIKDQKAIIKYFIQEGEYYKTQNIDLFFNKDLVTEKEKEEILALLHNQKDKNLNLLKLEEDIEIIKNYFLEKGYLEVALTNQEDQDLVTLLEKKDREEGQKENKANIFYKVHLGPQYIFKSYTIEGNKKTRTEIISREITFKEGDILNLSSIKKLEAFLQRTNLFSTVIVKYLEAEDLLEEEKKHKIQKRVNVLVQVVEKDFGLLEIAPGVRADTGPQVLAKISYNNLWGKNIGTSFKTVSNYRITYDQFDKRRQQEKKELIEYEAEASLTVPYVFPSFFGPRTFFNASLGNQQKRFFSFDAQIIKTSLRLSRQLWDNFFLEFGHQLEIINHFDSSNSKDEGMVRIGSLQGALVYDKRDSVSFPRSGFLSRLSLDFANPYFFSMKTGAKSFNFLTALWQNKIYAPLGNLNVLALSASLGHQMNFDKSLLGENNQNDLPKTRGYIPSIKALGPVGGDAIRGYSESESSIIELNGAIRRLSSVVLQENLTLLSFKIEPRFFINETLYLGVFMDIGKLSYNQSVTPLNKGLWSHSVGLALKYITPVGPIDIDYGVKLSQREVEGTKDEFGRLYFSVGLF